MSRRRGKIRAGDEDTEGGDEERGSAGVKGGGYSAPRTASLGLGRRGRWLECRGRVGWEEEKEEEEEVHGGVSCPHHATLQVKTLTSEKGGNGDGCGMGDALAVGSIWLAPASPGVADGADACPWSRSGLSSAAMSRMIANGLLMSTARGRKPVLPLILIHRQISHSGRLNASRLLHSPKVEI